MAQKVYIVELDAKIGAALKRMEELQAATVNTSNRMTEAFTRVSNAMEKDVKKTSNAVANFSKRDLGMLTSQLLANADATGKLGSQLSNLVGGLLTGGFVGAAFAGFAALINAVTNRNNELNESVEKLTTKAGTLVDKMELYKEQLRYFSDPKLSEAVTFGLLSVMGLSADEIGTRMEAIKKLRESILKDMVMTTHGKGYLAGLSEELSTLKSLQMSAVSESEAMSFNNKILEVQEKIDRAHGKQKETEVKKTEELSRQYDIEVKKTEELSRQYDIMDDIYQRMKEMDDEMEILGDVTLWGKLPRTDEKKVREPKWDEIYKHIEKAQDPMGALVSLSNQMASNFSFAGHTFVGQLSQAIAMVDSISNMILTVASIFGGGGFGIGGLLSLIGLEKGGRVTNFGGAISHTKIPSFAMGGSYSTPAFDGAYPVLVHKNETLDVYNAGQTSKMENKLDQIRNAILTTNVHVSKKGKGGGSVIKVNIGRKEIASIVQEELNNFAKSGYNLGEF